jgi:hypothetical protein
MLSTFKPGDFVATRHWRTPGRIIALTNDGRATIEFCHVRLLRLDELLPAPAPPPAAGSKEAEGARPGRDEERPRPLGRATATARRSERKGGK